MVVLDANGVIGTMAGLPSLSNTQTWTSAGADFPAATNPDDANAMSIGMGPLTVAFYRVATATGFSISH